MSPDTAATIEVRAVRAFNRFYTRRLGLLHAYLGSDLTLAQVRLLYELAHRERPSAAELARDLSLDTGYLSRILRQFRKAGLITTRPAADRRRQLLSLTRKGEAAFADLDERSHEDIAALLAPLDAEQRRRLVGAMDTIETLLRAEREPAPPYVLRPHRSGDMGWVVQRHGELYADEYGWDETFEALVASIVARFIERYDARRERCWIAEIEGERVGSVFCVRRSKDVAQLRLLLVDPRARGMGLGSRLVDECIAFARAAGYRKLVLWTNDVLVAARRVYERAGFTLTKSEPHQAFGHDLVEQWWELRL